MRIYLRIFLLFFALYSSQYLVGQDTLGTHYPNGQLKECKILVNGRPVRVFKYLEDGKMAFKWDKQSKTLEIFTALDESDTPEAIFDTICPDQTVIQHFGQGPVYSVFHGTSKNMDGEMTFYNEDGTISGQGHYTNHRKSGIWAYHYTDGQVERKIYLAGIEPQNGISIDYTVVPVLLTLTILGIFFFLSIRFATYYLFYKLVGLFTFISFGSVLCFAQKLDRSNGGISFSLTRYFMPVVGTMITVMLLLSIFNMVFVNRLKIGKRLSLFFLIAAIVLLFFLYVGAHLGASVAM